ncbi:Hypothetical protein R9X50_00581600 [Acrodontium crateriforme]|uniref:Uncharacterized protein n=1 Tax=Acrodontium crateriforme TaxID=150365 RepID=A0AAQ3M8Q2_9PEZI|nr:Hypothetical protein R9X50_00581600 [Acrodontium crateriforme]
MTPAGLAVNQLVTFGHGAAAKTESSINNDMQFIVSLVAFSYASLALAGACTGNGDSFSQECVTLYNGENCPSNGVEASYKPTCAGNCYVYGFNSLNVQGSYFYGTNCHAYSDSNCQNEIGSSGNIVGAGAGKCFNFQGGQSMKCYYNC